MQKISKKKRRIGIRKVLGASIKGIVLILTKDFIRIVVIAIILAIPLSIYLGDKWLENFAHRSSMSWWMFALAGFIALFIAVLTVSLQSIKAALANPVDSLRSNE